MISTGASQRAGIEPLIEPLIEPGAGDLPSFRGSIQADNLPPPLRPELLPALETLVQQVRPQGLWLFGSWARGTASRRSDVDLLVMGLERCRLLDSYDVVLEALQGCRLPLQPLVATRQLLARHGDAPFWRTLRAEAIPLLVGSRFP
ncbi:MAG: nucleotidyltransferase domain-containing protein [Cyanobacteriota bacterium]|nr:nucleotidyltransferase domain-containing protein [Cyanobacteriota bacterium]